MSNESNACRAGSVFFKSGSPGLLREASRTADREEAGPGVADVTGGSQSTFESSGPQSKIRPEIKEKEAPRPSGPTGPRT